MLSNATWIFMTEVWEDKKSTNYKMAINNQKKFEIYKLRSINKKNSYIDFNI